MWLRWLGVVAAAVLTLGACSSTAQVQEQAITSSHAFVAFEDRYDGETRFFNPTSFYLWDLQEVELIDSERDVWCGEFQVHVRAFSDAPWILAPGTYGHCGVVHVIHDPDETPIAANLPDSLRIELESEGRIPDYVYRLPPAPSR